MPLSPGTRLGSYEVTALIGQGGMAAARGGEMRTRSNSRWLICLCGLWIALFGAQPRTQSLGEQMLNAVANGDVAAVAALLEQGVDPRAPLPVRANIGTPPVYMAAELKNAEAMVRSRRADIARTEEKLHRFGLTDDDLRELDSADSIHRTKSHNTLKAPFSGVIIGYDVAEGELVAPDRQLLTLADMSILWVLADVYEKDLGQVSEGKQVEVQSPAYPNRVFRGRLTYISDVLDSATRTAKVRCVVPNRDRALKLEMFVTVKIPSNRESFSVAVPESAIQNIDGQDAVFAQQREGVFRKQTVQTGLRSDGWIAVTGLPEGTPVVSTGSFYLKSILKREAIGEEH